MHLDKFVNSKTGKIIMSILLGLGLATLFRSACKGNHCKVIKAPPLEELDDKIYKFDDKCYQLKKNNVKCDTTKNILNFA
jgi:hypothetical protein